jgi:hypothetical protein
VQNAPGKSRQVGVCRGGEGENDGGEVGHGQCSVISEQ